MPGSLEEGDRQSEWAPNYSPEPGGKHNPAAFWIAVYGLPTLPPALFVSLTLLVQSGSLDGHDRLRFDVMMLLAMGSFIGLLVAFSLVALAIGLWVFGLETWPTPRSRILGVSCLCTAVTLFASCFWFWNSW
jgi:hypothetical protein